jgi:hypothetical protein
VTYLAACDWSAPWHGPQEIARRLGADGHRVAYVETLGRRRFRPSDLPRAAGRVRRALARRPPAAGPSAGVTLVSPLVLPGAQHRAERALNMALVSRALRRAGAAERPDILWVYTPTALACDLVDRSPARLVLYHCTQSHRHRPGAPRETEAYERRVMSRAGLVVTDGIELYRERAGHHPHVVRIPSGVSPWQDGSAAPPGWARSLPRPVVGYLGSIDHRIDLRLVEAVARRRPDWSVVLVGPVGDVSVDAVSRLPNVHLHGQVPAEQVPSVLAAFDVGVMPYAGIDMTRYTYPAKLHQYFAAGLPIASTGLPDLAEFADLVETGDGEGGFADAVARAAAGPDRASERRAVASRNTWESRYADLREAICTALAAAPAET